MPVRMYVCMYVPNGRYCTVDGGGFPTGGFM